MRPPFNSFPHRPQQNGFQSNSAVANQCNNNMNMLMMQPQMGIFNPQLPTPLSNNINNINKNSSVMPLLNNAGFMNGANQQFPTQNNSTGFPQIGPIFPNMNNLAMFQQLPAQFNNSLHNPNQPNWLNLPQQNNMGLTNGQQQRQQLQQQQLFLQNQLQNVSQLLNAQLPDLSQFVSGGQAIVPNPHFGFMQPNQMQQQANQSQQNLADVNASNLSSAPASQVPGDPSFRRPTGGPGKNSQNMNNFPGRNAKRDSKWGSQKSKFDQPRFHQADNAKRAFASSNGHKKKVSPHLEKKITGPDNERAAKFPHSNSANPAKEKRRSLALTYTEEEIRKWREERKKFYPTKANIKKKLSGKVADSEVAKSRSEQLKEILAKQAELGVEVAEIPPQYLRGMEKRVNGREENHRPSTKRGRFGMRNDKRGRPDKRDHFSKKPKPTTEESFDGSSFSKRSPTLLQKLLSADIRKDKSRLLQVLRFMVMNSFFKDWPEKPLKFPVVVVKDGVSEGEIVQEKTLLDAEDNIEAGNKTMTQSIVDGAGDDDIKNNNADEEEGEEDDDDNE
ncbi:homeobox protein 4 isoform X1 [Gossypium hirsutum]|uniref:Homeobox protein 4 isoform X1 n=1 Tax=Gossypium hirsutum TaxID=3635 RepID=A0ABM3BYH2_GOSHI|nr:homeobox protein 4 isoform X1 [Gossypium hirsutum]